MAPLPYSGDIELEADRHEEWLELMAELAQEDTLTGTGEDNMEEAA
jgi:hypothetical protein